MTARTRVARLGASIAAAACLLLASSCAAGAPESQTPESQEAGGAALMRILDAGPESLDPQCAPNGDTYALNVYDRLMETRATEDGTVVEPSLAESVEVSDDGLAYTFRLREGVTFSNGSPLTSDDVGFTLRRLITHPSSENKYLAFGITGADDLAQGRTSALAGFEAADNLTFTIRLDRPRPAFLAALSATGASVIDEETTLQAGVDFGDAVETAVGTGPYVLAAWEPNTSFTLTANPSCWSGAPSCAEVRVDTPVKSVPYRTMFQEGELDILDISELDLDAEYFSRGDLYRKNLVRGLKADITCIVLGDATAPLDDRRVREALRAAIDRKALLKAVAGGRGVLENGIIPDGLSCGRTDMPDIAYDPDRARALLAEAGLGAGFDLELSYSADSSAEEQRLTELLASMWQEVGVRATVVKRPTGYYGAASSAGTLGCRVETAMAAYDDPETVFFSLAVDGGVPAGRALAGENRAASASAIADDDARMQAYRDLDRALVADSCTVIPLYSQSEVFVVANRVEGTPLLWNGAEGVDLRNVKLAKAQG